MGVAITWPPAGVVSLFGLRDMGAQLPLLNDELTGVADLTELYLINRREQLLGANVAVNAQGGFGIPELVVPVGELWYVWSFQLTVGTGAGSSLTWAPAAALQPGGTSFVLNEFVTCPANEQRRTFIDEPLWLPSGCSLSFVVGAVTAGPINVTPGAVITRLRI